MANEVRLRDVSEKIFGITWRRYRQMAKEGIVPPPVDEKIDFVLAAKGLIDYYRKLAEGSGTMSLTDERTELVKVQRELKNLELLLKRGDLIPKDQILSEFLDRIKTVKSGLISFSKYLPPVLALKDAREIAPILKKEVNQLLERFSRKGGILK